MVIGLLILMPVIAIITGFFTLKAYKLGLTHSWELKHDMKPTEKPSIIEKVIDNKQAEKQENRVQGIVDQWLNGGE